MGKFYWKLNVKLLELENIEKDFKEFWNNITNLKPKYENLNQWWELCGKIRIRQFFQKKKGQEQSRLK